MTTSTIRYCLVIGIFGGLLSSGMVQGQSQDGQAWLEEARAGWSRIENRPLPCAWDSRVFEQIFKEGGKTSNTVAFGSLRLIENGRWQLLVDGTLPANGQLKDPIAAAAFALVCNDDYAFRLERTSPERPWQVLALASREELEKTRSDDPKYRWYHEYFFSARASFLLAPVSEGGVLLSELVDWDGAQVEEAKAEGNLYRVKLLLDSDKAHYFPRSHVRRQFRNERIELLFDPNHDWRIVKSTSTSASLPTPTIRELTYDDTGRLQSEVTENSRYVRREVRYSNVRLDCDHDKADFRLPAFGIPEPEELQPKRKWWRWYVAAGMLGVVLLLVGIKLRRG